MNVQIAHVKIITDQLRGITVGRSQRFDDFVQRLFDNRVSSSKCHLRMKLNPDHTTIEVREDAGRLRVIVVYDASDSLIMALGGMLPRPPSVIRRSAVIHVGDY